VRGKERERKKGRERERKREKKRKRKKERKREIKRERKKKKSGCKSSLESRKRALTAKFFNLQRRTLSKPWYNCRQGVRTPTITSP